MILFISPTNRRTSPTTPQNFAHDPLYFSRQSVNFARGPLRPYSRFKPTGDYKLFSPITTIVTKFGAIWKNINFKCIGKCS